MLAGYRLETASGAGGMAVVFRARDERLGRLAALKVLAPALTSDASFRRRFMAESRAAAAVDDPHIIPVYQAGEADGVLFIAMRFVAGGDLRGMVGQQGALPPGRAAAFLSPVASALDAAHAIGLVHRDIKPANMLVDAGPGRPEHVYLSDFGLARGVMSLSGLTRAGQFLGTPDYSAPEQISGQTVDGRADQYALACVAYTLLTGTVPFVRDHPMAALYAHLHEPPPRVTAVRPELSAAVDQVLAIALAKAPDDRYESCGAFADALRQALGVGPYGSPEPGRPATDAGVVPAGPGRQQTMLETTLAAGGMPATPPALAPPATLTKSLSAPPDSAAPAPAVRTLSPVPDAASLPAAPGSSARPNATGTWTAVVSADRAYYDSVQADSTPDAALISFPDHFQERR